MAKMTLEELRKLREEQKKKLRKRDSTVKNIEIIIGMGTCGIAAGAKEALNTFVHELDDHNVEHVLVKQPGCMGLCYAEPTVEVIMPDMPAIIYGKVDEETARKIVRKHILGGFLINDHIFDRPAVDIIKE
jgi:NADP-reducing hydrogenase subunit HndB